MSSPALPFPSARCRRFRSLIYFAVQCVPNHASTSHENTWISGVQKRDDGRWDILTSSSSATDHRAFDVVVNALWEGRLAVDATAGVVPSAPWSHRFRAGVFGQATDGAVRSAVLCTGPFGDVKQYADGRVYLSWYEAGLIAEEMRSSRRATRLC